jgi:hypothetical protein
MPKESDILHTAEQVSALLAKSGIPSFVIGAVALAAHRYIRFTQDLDLAVDADVELMRKITSDLYLAGYEAVFYEPDATDPLGGVIDISGAFGLVQIISFSDRFPIVIHESLAEREIFMHSGSSLRVMPIPQLIALKLYAGGHKAKSDIIELLKRNPGYDRAEITQTMKRYRLRGIAAIWKEMDLLA